MHRHAKTRARLVDRSAASGSAYLRGDVDALAIDRQLNRGAVGLLKSTRSGARGAWSTNVSLSCTSLLMSAALAHFLCERCRASDSSRRTAARIRIIKLIGVVAVMKMIISSS